MARPKKVTQMTSEPVAQVAVEKSVETVEKPSTPILIAKDDSVVTRKAPTMDVKHVVGRLAAGCAYKIKKTVNGTIYGDFYLLESGLYVSKVGNFTVK